PDLHRRIPDLCRISPDQLLRSDRVALHSTGLHLGTIPEPTRSPAATRADEGWRAETAIDVTRFRGVHECPSHPPNRSSQHDAISGRCASGTLGVKGSASMYDISSSHVATADTSRAMTRAETRLRSSSGR